MKCYFTEINPKDFQKKKINQTIGVCRFLKNLYISKNKDYYTETGKFLTGNEFDKYINNEFTKDTHYHWIKEVSSKSRKHAIMDIDKAFRNFFKKKKGFPKYRKKRNQDVSVYFIPSTGRLEIERHRIKIPTLGWVHVKEKGYLPLGKIGISCTVSYKAGRYYVSVLCDSNYIKNKKVKDKKEDYTLKYYTEGIGIDLGIKKLAVCSNYLAFDNINYSRNVRRLEKKLKREQRSLSRKYENKKKNGNLTCKNINKNILRIQKIHQKLSNIRENYIRYVVTTLVKIKPEYTTIEDLNVRGMLKNRHLSNSISNQKFYRFKEWLLWKCQEYGIELRQVNKFYPSSKLCSDCGFKKVKLSLSERVYRCENCGLEIDRDYNASLNLKNAKEYIILT